MMNRSYLLVFVIVSALTLASCGEAQKETPSGYKFKVIKKGSGDVAKPGEIVAISMVLTDDRDSVWFDNRVTGYPELVMIREEELKVSEHGVVEAFRMLAEGDSAEFPMTARDVFTLVWRREVPQFVNPDAIYKFHLKCLAIMDSAETVKYRQQLDSAAYEREKVAMAEERERMAREEMELEAYNREQLKKDTVLIDNYLKGKNVKGVKKTPSGIRYILKSNGSGQTPSDGQFARVKYAGQLLDGTEFDSGEYTFTVGGGDVIKGWDEIVRLMKPGGSVTVFIPSTYAYGRNGRLPVIAPDAILVFEMELTGVTKP